LSDAAETARNDTIQRVSVVDNVTVLLRRALLAGEIKPGERINVAELERTFGVSHIPIREALRRLETEGLVVTLPQRTAVAAGVDLADLDGLYDLRRMIEGEVAERAAREMTPDELAKLKAALAALEEAATDVSSPLFWQRHNEFHWALLEPGATAWVRRVLEQAWSAAERYVRLFVSETVERAMREHRGLVAACERGEPERVRELLVAHLDRSQRTIRNGLVRAD
jgi:DNA-binding GntR family transcriptional regulator